MGNITAVIEENSLFLGDVFLFFVFKTWSYCVDEAGLELRDRCASVSQVLVLQCVHHNRL